MRVGFSIFLRRILLGLVFFGAIRSIIISRAGITVFALAGFRAAPLTPALRLFLGGVIPRRSIAISFFWGIHHVYVIRRGGFPAPYRCWFLIVSCIGVHTVDVFGVDVEYVS